MAWRNCRLYSLENCGPGKPCKFNGPVNYHCSGRTLPEPERRDTMPVTKKAKKKTIAKKTKKPALPVAIQEGSPEDVRQGAAPAIALVQRAQDLLKDISEITDELEDRQERLANVKQQLRDTKFSNDKITVEFGWDEGPESPSARVGVLSERGFAYVEVSLEELDEMVEWCAEQLNGKPKQIVNL